MFLPWIKLCKLEKEQDVFDLLEHIGYTYTSYRGTASDMLHSSNQHDGTHCKQCKVSILHI